MGMGTAFADRAHATDLSDNDFRDPKEQSKYDIFSCIFENGIEIPFPQRDIQVRSEPETGSCSRRLMVDKGGIYGR